MNPDTEEVKRNHQDYLDKDQTLLLCYSATAQPQAVFRVMAVLLAVHYSSKRDTQE